MADKKRSFCRHLFVRPSLHPPDSPFDLALRPGDFSEFHGQTKVKEQLLVMIEAAKQRGEPLEES